MARVKKLLFLGEVVARMCSMKKQVILYKIETQVVKLDLGYCPL